MDPDLTYTIHPSEADLAFTRVNQASLKHGVEGPQEYVCLTFVSPVQS